MEIDVSALVCTKVLHLGCVHTLTISLLFHALLQAQALMQYCASLYLCCNNER